eukprot:snap_masked-scaffold_3-processed-gene-17.22-mRNA-1 protein AED:1.00 eAED:1.00 QI:0/-1/0/0/-1/1/1/0/77
MQRAYLSGTFLNLNFNGEPVGLGALDVDFYVFWPVLSDIKISSKVEQSKSPKINVQDKSKEFMIILKNTTKLLLGMR